MIKPSNLVFTTALTALTSHEAARFAGYDLEASTKEPVVLEETEQYTLVAVELTLLSGKVIQRKVKAYKNGTSEVLPEEPELPTVSLNPDANFFGRLAFAEADYGVHNHYANPGDVMFLAIDSDVTVAETMTVELNAMNATVTLDMEGPIVVEPGQVTLVPILVEAASAVGANFTALIKDVEGSVRGVSQSVEVSQTVVVPTQIILNPDVGTAGGPSRGITYAFDVPNYSAHSISVSCTNPGVTLKTFDTEQNQTAEGNIYVLFDAAQIANEEVLEIVVNIDGLTASSLLTYYK